MNLYPERMALGKCSESQFFSVNYSFQCISCSCMKIDSVSALFFLDVPKLAYCFAERSSSSVVHGMHLTF